jgi:hypothetical protein
MDTVPQTDFGTNPTQKDFLWLSLQIT